MVFQWRRAFCSSLPRELDSGSAIKTSRDQHEHESDCNGNVTRASFFSSSFSNPTTPTTHSRTDSSPVLLRRRTTSASLPSSPSTLSVLKSNLRISTNRCGLCLQSMKTRRGVAIFTAECSHTFHFPCISAHVSKRCTLHCPVCGATWQQTPLLPVTNLNQNHQSATAPENNAVVEKKKKNIKLKKLNSIVYNDDERLTSLTPKSRFNPIPESDENSDEDSNSEFLGFQVNSSSNNNAVDNHERDVTVRLLADTSLISANRSYETHVLALIAKAPLMTETQNRAPIDLVTVIDVSENMSNEKLQMMKRTMRIIISLLSSSDRLSIVAFCSYSKRILHLKRMTNTGKITATQIVNAMTVIDGYSNPTDAVRKAVKVLEDRRDKNTVASIILLSDVFNQSSFVSSTRYLDVAVHTLKVSKLAAIDDHALAKTVRSLLIVPVQDLQLQLGFVSGSAPAEITAVYSQAPRLVAYGKGMIQIGEMFANEEREMLIELKVPVSTVHGYRALSVRCRYRESVSQDTIYSNERELVVPRLHTVRSSTPSIQRLRNLFITTRALVESRRLAACKDLIGAYRMLISARAIVKRANSDSREFVISLEAELSELQQGCSALVQTGREEVVTMAYIDEKGEALSPTSAWRVAEKLAKVAIVRKSLNRVRDLHGFEDARF